MKGYKITVLKLIENLSKGEDFNMAYDSMIRVWLRRAASFFLCLLLILSAFPPAAQSAGETGINGFEAFARHAG